MQAARQRGDAVAGQVLAGLQGFSPPMLLAPGSRISGLLPQCSVNTVATVIPGPTRDDDTAPDIDVMCRGIDRGISDLLHADAAATRPGCTGSSGQRSVDPAGGEQ